MERGLSHFPPPRLFLIHLDYKLIPKLTWPIFTSDLEYNRCSENFNHNIGEEIFIAHSVILVVPLKVLYDGKHQLTQVSSLSDIFLSQTDANVFDYFSE